MKETDCPPTQKSGKEKLRNIWKKSRVYLIVSLLIAVVYCLFLAARNIYPFGSGSRVNSQYDLLAQICPFYEHIFDVINGKSSLFYSNAIAGGADVFGIFAFFAVSPFSPLFLIFGEGNVYAASAIVMPLKLIAIAVSAIFVVRKLFRNIPEYIVGAVGMLYAFSGYMFVANTYINWMDLLVYMPFCVLAFVHFTKTDKILPLVVSMDCMIYTCFSISCFSLFLVYLAFMAYVLIVVPKENRKHVAFRICLSLLYTVAAALPILCPALMAYIRSGRNTGIFSNLFEDLNSLHLYRKITYIVSDTFFLILTAAYFIRSKFRTKQDVFLLVIGIISLSYVLVDEICILLNFGSYMSYALRFGFLNSAYFLFMACLTLDSLPWKEEQSLQKTESADSSDCAETAKTADSPLSGTANGAAKANAQPVTVKKSRYERTKAKLAARAVTESSDFNGALILCVLAAAFIIGLFWIFKKVDSGELEWSKNAFSSFAHSTGALEIIAIIFGMVLVIFIVAYLLYKFRISKLSTIALMLCSVVIAQTICYNAMLIWGNTFNPTNYEQYATLADIAESIEGNDDFRIKDYGDALTSNIPLTAHGNSFSVFSSVTDADNFIVHDKFGYNGNGVNNLKSGGGSLLSDCLLGYKYYFYRYQTDGTESTLSRSYLKEVTVDGETQRTQSFLLYENIYAFPACYTVQTDSLSMEGGYLDYMEELHTFLGGEGSLVSYYPVEDRDITYQASGDYYQVRIYIREEGNISVFSAFTEEDGVLGTTSHYSEDKLSPYVGNHNLSYSKNIGSWYTLNLKAAEGATLTPEMIKANIRTAVIPLSKVAKLAEVTRSNACELEVGADSYRATAFAENDHTYLFLNYVAIRGMRATVNGKEAELLDNGLKFMLVKLEEGENVVEIVYHSPYPKYILLGIGGGGVLIAGLYLATKKLSKLCMALEKPVYVLALGLGGAIGLFYIVFPVLVFLFKCVSGLIGIFL